MTGLRRRRAARAQASGTGAPWRRDSRASWMTKMAFSPTMPDHHDPAHEARDVERHPGQQERAEDAREHGDGDDGGHEGRAPVAELEEQDDRDEQQAAEQDEEQLPERVLLLLVEAAERDAHAGRKAQPARELAADLLDGAAEIAPLEAGGDAEKGLQVLPVDLGLGRAGRNRGDVRERDERAARGAQAQAREPPRVAREQPQVVEAFADADVAGDGAGHRRFDGRLHVLGREAEARGAARPSLARTRVAGRHADGERRARDDDAVEDVLDALHAVQDPRDLAGAVLEQRLVLAEDVDVDGLRDAAGQVADVVLEQLPEIRVEGRGDRGGARRGCPRSRPRRRAAPAGASGG